MEPEQLGPHVVEVQHAGLLSSEVIEATVAQSSVVCQELLVASRVGEIPIRRCSSILLNAEAHPQPVEAASLAKPYQIDDLLADGKFCVEIPSENFLSELIMAKLQKVPPQERSSALAALMQEQNLSRVIIVSSF